MPNGFYGSREEWEQMVAPLRELDDTLNAFARRHLMEVTPNYHNMPNRMLRWTKDGIQRQLQISLYGDRLIQFSCAAWRDSRGKRHGTRWPPIDGIPLQVFKAEMLPLLEDGRTRLDAVTEADLEYWTELS